MGYVIGISSGMFMAAAEGEKETYLTIPRKIFYGGTKGVTFTQLDLESITEFKEPKLQENVKRIKELGMRFGVHGESYAMGGAERPISMLDSALESEYMHAHQRLIQHIEGAGSIGAEYLLIHSSENTPWIRLGMTSQPTKLVDPWGGSLADFLDNNTKILDWVIEQKFLTELFIGRRFRDITIKDFQEAEIKKMSEGGKEITEEVKQQIFNEVREFFKKELKIFVTTVEPTTGPERIAYYIIAKWMMMEKHPLWMSIVGRILKDEELPALAGDPEKSWVPAVAAMYFSGHFNPRQKQFKDPKPLLDKYKMYFVIETPMAGHGIEGLLRLAHPLHFYHLAKNIGSKWVTVAFDSEHLLGSNINPLEAADSFPANGGELVRVIHMGYPTPHQPAHMGIAVGSEAQRYLYEMLFKLRKKGFKDGYLIFERAAEATIKQSILAIRLIVEQLEKDVPPDQLPEEFYGMPKGGPSFVRQEVSIREHALDPLKGLLSIPEEEWSFLGAAAREKGKAEEWKKEKYK